MAEYKEANGTRSFAPDDDKNTFYIECRFGFDMELLIEKIHEKFGPDVDMSMVKIEPQHIQTRCLGHDRYDPGDYDDYIVITRET